MIKINYESDFKLTEKTEGRFADVPFTFTYTTNSGIYTASYDGGAYTRCKRNEDGSITVIFNDHGLGVGKLRVRREFFIPDEDFPDGVYNIISNDTTDVILVEGKTEGFDVENSFRPPYIEGDGDTIVSVEVVDNLDSDATGKALSARQGKVLKGMIPTKVSELYNDEGYITELPDNLATKDDVSEAVSGKQDALTLTVKDNGNIVIGNISGQSKEFMPATPSGDPMHWAYVSAGAVYNATDDFILKAAPWKGMVDTIEDKAKWGLDVVDASRVKQMTIGAVVYNYATENRTSPEGGTYLRYFLVGKGSNGVWVEDETKVLHLPKCWYLNGLGDITNDEMRRIVENKFIVSVWEKSRAIQSIKARTLLNPYTLRYTDGIGVITNLHDVNIESLTFSIYAFNIVPMEFCIPTSMVGGNQKNLKYIACTKNLKNIIHNNVRVLPINKLAASVNISSPVISKESIRQNILNAAPTSAITITLHPDAYARLVDDADIVAALEAKPLVTLVSE